MAIGLIRNFDLVKMDELKIEYFTDPKFKKMEIIKMGLFFPIFGLIIYFLVLKGIGNIVLYLVMIIPIGIFGTWQVMRNSRNIPSVIIGDAGITINNPLELGLIEWEEIAGVRQENILDRKLLCIDLKNPNNHKKGLTKIIKKKAETNESKLKTHIAIMEKYVSYRTQEIKAKIEEKIN